MSDRDEYYAAYRRRLAEQLDPAGFPREVERTVIDGQRGQTVLAPFPLADVQLINRWQQSALVHPYTCPVHPDTVLHAAQHGLVCTVPECTRRQDWVHSFTVDAAFLDGMLGKADT